MCKAFLYLSCDRRYLILKMGYEYRTHPVEVTTELLKDSVWIENCPDIYNSKVLLYDGTKSKICYPGVGFG